LDPAKRSQLGAHYTDRDKIMKIVNPVVVEPLLAEWAVARGEIEAALARGRAAKSAAAATRAHNDALARLAGFLERLRGFRILDPACGSGNFLYLSLRALKDIEHRVNVEAEALGLPRAFPSVGPEAVLGLELNPFAAELARVSVWIGEIQWMRQNGYEAARDPILRPLDTIECRDAILNADGTRAEWPGADVVVGNPPFLGNKRMLSELGEEYTNSLRSAWRSVPGGVDLVAYWFVKAWNEIEAGRLRAAGLVATNSIRGGISREILKPIVEHGRIFEAWSDEEWIVDGAAVRVSVVCFDKMKGGEAVLDGVPTQRIASDLTTNAAGYDLSAARKLAANSGVSFQGVSKVGSFEIDGFLARQWMRLPLNPNGKPNKMVLRPWITGTDLTARNRDEWVVDFGTNLSLEDAALYEMPFHHLRELVLPERRNSRRDAYRKRWWIHGEARPGMRDSLRALVRYIATPKVSKHRFFVYVPSSVLASNLVIAVARDDDTSFGILGSRFHELWSLALGQWIGAGNDPTYTPSTTFETFPFPEGLSPDLPAAAYADDPRARGIAVAAAELDRLRQAWLNPPDLVRREPEVVAGYPDRLLPVSDAAAAILKTRTLTNLYNARPAWLDAAHARLDAAVADAYGWGEDWRAGRLDDDAILARLFALNQSRAA
ncbi:class I SAM-dependent DNA methyltransferase, partial [Amaricoccus sp.]|uniref:class I SAM-dependent DNA methyltransferase n=1 Tax=Amaricoccus sp. TaxID=1872485 RepID=UPI001B45E8F6